MRVVRIKEEDVKLLREVACCPTHQRDCSELAGRLEGMLRHEGAKVLLLKTHEVVE